MPHISVGGLEQAAVGQGGGSGTVARKESHGGFTIRPVCERTGQNPPSHLFLDWGLLIHMQIPVV